MKSITQIKTAIEEIKNRISHCKLKRNQYEAREDFVMVKMWLNEESQLIGQLSALDWVLRGDYENQD